MFNKSMLIVTGILISGAGFIQAETGFRQWQQSQMQQFQQYKDDRDQAYVDLLEKHWRALRASKGQVHDGQPKPEDPPLVSQPRPAIPEAGETPVIQLPDFSQPGPVTKAILPEPSWYPDSTRIALSFFGDDLTVYLPDSFRTRLIGRLSQSEIAGSWKTISQTDYEPVIEQIGQIVAAYQLSDWATVQLVWKLSNQIYSGQSEQTMMAWFLLTKIGFDARAAFNSHTLYLLLPMSESVFETSYATVEGRRYYFFTTTGARNNASRVKVFQGKYDSGLRQVVMNFDAVNWQKPRIHNRNLSYQWENETYSLDLLIFLNDIELLETYPQLELQPYFQSRPNEVTSSQLLSQLSQHIDGRPEIDSVNMLLRFVQTGFDYATDQQQFGAENYLLPVETLYYPASDCEDRAVLFAWLVNELLNLEVIVLNYPGHVATAVNMKGRYGGDLLNYMGKTYWIADPTYINALAGMRMTKFKNITPDILVY